jgi:hypothetical protein
MFLIKREKGFEGNFPSFTTRNAAIKYIEDNTGAFDSNEIIALIEFETQIVSFVKLELTIVPRIL